MSNLYSVMIVDDSAEDRYLLKRFLKKSGLDLVILEANGAQKGIDLLTAPADELKNLFPGISAPVTIFLDINMPVMNGWEFIEAIETLRPQIHLQPTVVMMYSTSDNDSDKEKASTYSSVACYIVKGDSTPEALKEAILSHR